MPSETAGLWDQIAGKWKQMTGDIRTQWGKLTDDDLEQIAGQRDKFVGRVQEVYGITQEEASHQINEWERKLKF